MLGRVLHLQALVGTGVTEELDAEGHDGDGACESQDGSNQADDGHPGAAQLLRALAADDQRDDGDDDADWAKQQRRNNQQQGQQRDDADDHRPDSNCVLLCRLAVGTSVGRVAGARGGCVRAVSIVRGVVVSGVVYAVVFCVVGVLLVGFGGCLTVGGQLAGACLLYTSDAADE